MFIRLGAMALAAFGLMTIPSYGRSKATPGEDQGSTLRFKLREGYKVLVPVSVNGHEPENFILDTGTKTSVVDTGTCRQIGLRTIALMPLTTFAGTSTVTISQTESISMGNATVTGLEVACADLRKIYSLDSETHGILGQNFLVRFNYLLDYRERRIVLDEAGTLRRNLDGTELPIEVNGYRDYFQYDSGPAAQQPVRFMLDSGTPIPVIFENPRVNSALSIEREMATMYSPGSVAGRRVDVGRIRTLNLNGTTINNLSVRLTQAAENEKRWENGLFPTALCRAVYFNHERGYVILNPRIGSR